MYKIYNDSTNMATLEHEAFVGELTQKIGMQYSSGAWSQDSASGVLDGISLLDGANAWNPVTKERIERLATSFGMITAERFLEALERRLWSKGDPAIAENTVGKLYDATLDVYRRCGKRAGAYFLYSYPAMIDLKQDPRPFADEVIKTKESGGAHFAAWYAYSVPNAVEAGIGISEFAVSSSIVRNKSSLRLTKEFMKTAPTAVKNGETFQDFTDTALEVIERLDPNSAFNALLPSAVFQLEFDIPPGEVIDDIAAHSDRFGEKSAGWYSYGIRRIADKIEAYKRQQESIKRNPLYPDYITTIDPVKKDSIDQYKENYTKMLEEVGLSTAIFYSRTFNLDDSREYSQKLLDLRQKAGKKIFNKALWVIARATGSHSEGSKEMMEDLNRLLDNETEETIWRSLLYTLGAVKKGTRSFKFLDPRQTYFFGEAKYDATEKQWLKRPLTDSEEEFAEPEAVVEEPTHFVSTDTVFTDNTLGIIDEVIMYRDEDAQKIERSAFQLEEIWDELRLPNYREIKYKGDPYDDADYDKFGDGDHEEDDLETWVNDILARSQPIAYLDDPISDTDTSFPAETSQLESDDIFPPTPTISGQLKIWEI